LNLEQCLERIEEDGFPIFRRTLEVIVSLESSSEPIPKLAEKILGDPGISIKLIQIANSPFFNPGGDRVKTVTRAIMLLGLQNVKGIALSLALLEDLIKKGRRKKIVELFALGLARAVTARNLGIATRCSSPEEIYISGLLYDIGDIALELVIDPKKLEAIEEKAKQNGETLEIAQKNELGFSAKDLSREINTRWKLSDILERVFLGDYSTPEALCLKTANELAKKSILKSLNTKSENDISSAPEIHEEIAQIGKILKLKNTEVGEILEESFKEARYFLKDVLHIPIPYEELESTMEAGDKSPSEVEPEEKETTQEPEKDEVDFNTFVNLSYDMVSLIHSGFKDINAFFSLAMELIYNGLNMDVVLLLLMNPDRESLFVKYSLIRPGVRGLLMPEKITINGLKSHIFSHLINTKATDPLWINETSPEDMVELIKHPLVSSFITIPCCISPISIKQHIIGFIYGDRRNNPHNMTEKHFTGFGIVSRLTSIGLTMFAPKKGD